MDVRHAWSVRRRESGHWSGSSRRRCDPEANEQGLVDLRSDPSGKPERMHSREQCARGTALPETLERLSYGVRIRDLISHQLPCGTPPCVSMAALDVEIYR